MKPDHAPPELTSSTSSLSQPDASDMDPKRNSTQDARERADTETEARKSVHANVEVHTEKPSDLERHRDLEKQSPLPSPRQSACEHRKSAAGSTARPAHTEAHSTSTLSTPPDLESWPSPAATGPADCTPFHRFLRTLWGPSDRDDVSILGTAAPQTVRPQTVRPRSIPPGLVRHLPSKLATLVDRTWLWIQGPATPAPRVTFRPVFPDCQRLVPYYAHKLLPRKWLRICAYALLLLAWLLTFVLVKRTEFATNEVGRYGTPAQLFCTSNFWGLANRCGLDAQNCRPFRNEGVAFRCPANCASVRVLNPRWVGTDEVNYRNFVIGGPAEDGTTSAAIYRADSHICVAAIHAGVISDKTGGCGVVHLIGTAPNFTASTHHGISSLGFDSYFPKAFTFFPPEAARCTDGRDKRWQLLGLSVMFTVLLSLATTGHPAAFFFPLTIGLYWQVGASLDPVAATSASDMVASMAAGFLPTMFIVFVMYEVMGVRYALSGRIVAPVEKTVLWLGGCWVGIMNNYTLGWIPISRLTSRDLTQQSGAKGALAGIVIVLFVVVCLQFFYLQKERRLIPLLQFYAVVVVCIIVCVPLPGLNLHIHHYSIALVLLPGTKLQTRLSWLLQGFLVGLFLHGASRWGLDSLLETEAVLRGQDGLLGSPLPEIPVPSMALANRTLSTISFTWNDTALATGMGLSMLVNDVERMRWSPMDTPVTSTLNRLGDLQYGYSEADPLANDTTTSGPVVFTWSRPEGVRVREYIRFAYLSKSLTALDYTEPGVWDADGKWTAGDARS